MGLRKLAERLGDVAALDPAADGLDRSLGRLRQRPLWDVLRGSWLGHPAHPMLTDVPIGLWTSGVTLDWVGGERTDRGADVLILLGAIGALPTVAAGLADWSEASLKARRQGLVHAGLNVVALTLFLVSLAMRAVNRSRGRKLTLLALGLLMGGGYLGAHLTYVEGVGVDRRAAVEPGRPPGAAAASVGPIR